MNCVKDVHYNAKCAGFYASLAISLLALMFCIIKLFMLQPGEDKSIYIAIITSILGVWSPSPKLPDRSKIKDTILNAEGGLVELRESSS